MNLFEEARTALKNELAPLLGVAVYTGWPTKLSPPFAFMLPPFAGPYVRGGPAFHEVTIAVDLIVVVDHGEPDYSLAQVEGLIEIILREVDTWVIGEVESPIPTTIAEAGAEYLAAAIHLSKPVRIDDQ